METEFQSIITRLNGGIVELQSHVREQEPAERRAGAQQAGRLEGVARG
jgi:hypothetical protein